jgi:hypothetical protein
MQVVKANPPKKELAEQKLADSLQNGKLSERIACDDQ